MSLDVYLFEKAGYVPDHLAGVAEDLNLLGIGSPASREIAAYLNVALRHGLMTCCAIAGAPFDGQAVVDLSRQGRPAWKHMVLPALEFALFGPDERDDDLKRTGLPRTHPEGAEPREIDVAEVLPRATKSLAALLDLVEIVRKHRCYEIEDGRFRSHLTMALNGATKVLTTLLNAEWDTEWPEPLADRGREALDAVVARLQDSGDMWCMSAEDLGPLEEAWLSETDPNGPRRRSWRRSAAAARTSRRRTGRPTT